MAPRTKITSVRLYSETLDRIEAFSAEHPAFSRNLIICTILKKIFDKVSEDEIYKLLCTANPDSVFLITTKQDLMINVTDNTPEND